MSYSKKLCLLMGSILMMAFSAQVSHAQTFKVNNKASKMIVEGSSNIHDWEVEAEDCRGDLNVELEGGQLVKINNLDFTVIAESLKSGKSGMDKNTYKALKTDDYDKITYKLTKVDNIDCTSGSSCKVITSGYLTIAGAKKAVDITFDANVSDSKIVLSGSKTIKMSQFNIEPPTAMFGAITTDDEVTVNFKTVFTK